MKLLLRAYPRRWRERYGEELLVLLEAEPLTWGARADVVAAGLAERFRPSAPGHLRVLWAWSLFVIGGIAFQKTSEHWKVVVPSNDWTVPSAAFDCVQVAAVIAGAAVLGGIGLALPDFFRDLRGAGWAALRRRLLASLASTAVAGASLLALAFDHGVAVATVFAVSAVVSLFAWTRPAVAAARRLPPRRVHTALAFVVTAAMVVMAVAATVWFASVTAHAPSFVGAAQLAVTASFMLAGIAVAASPAVANRKR